MLGGCVCVCACVWICLEGDEATINEIITAAVTNHNQIIFMTNYTSSHYTVYSINSVIIHARTHTHSNAVAHIKSTWFEFKTSLGTNSLIFCCCLLDWFFSMVWRTVDWTIWKKKKQYPQKSDRLTQYKPDSLRYSMRFFSEWFG